jgi:hypothetical protein
MVVLKQLPDRLMAIALNVSFSSKNGRAGVRIQHVVRLDSIHSIRLTDSIDGMDGWTGRSKSLSFFFAKFLLKAIFWINLSLRNLKVFVTFAKT